MLDRDISMQRRRLLIGSLGAAALSTAAGRALAESYPARPIVFICPWSAGGTADLTMRALVSVAAKQLGALVSAHYPLERFEEALAHAGQAGSRGATKIVFESSRSFKHRKDDQ